MACQLPYGAVRGFSIKKNSFVESPKPDIFACLKVCHLIYGATNNWNMQNESEVLNGRDVELMNKLASSPEYLDTWYWNDDLRGLYSVKGTYRLLCGELRNDVNIGFTRWS